MSALLLLLLFNTTRAHTPDPQAQEPLSQWTEVWPTQPVSALMWVPGRRTSPFHSVARFCLRFQKIVILKLWSTLKDLPTLL